MGPAYRSVGTVEAVHGSRGEVRLRLAGDGTNPLAAGQGVVLVPPRFEDRRRKTIAGIREDRGGCYLTFEDVRDRGAAELCVGRTVLALADELPADWGRPADGGLVGLEVRDAVHGAIGRVAAVEEGPAQSLLVVEGPFGQVLIPAVEPILGEVVDGTLRVACPDGLIELAREGED